MRKKRVLIVDDSVVIRRSLADGLSRDPALEVMGAAPNGRVALMRIPLVHPDVVTLDTEMPEMSGLETLAAIRHIYPKLPVIMLNEPTEQGAAITLDALSSGALDYVTKPETNSKDTLEKFSREVASKIASCCPDVSQQRTIAILDSPSIKSARLSGGSAADKRVDILAIGVSTGGPNALMDLIPQFAADFPIPILIVQHMPPVFTKILAERLAAKCKVHVAEGQLNQKLLPGTAWIAPGDFHMAVERANAAVDIQLHQGPPEKFCRPAVDVLFRSVAEVYGRHVLAVVLTGMGQDGFRGCQQIHAAGGQVLVQDEASSVVWGMPRFIARAGIADEILSLRDLGPEIISRVWRHRAAKPHDLS
jgi:two-component system chemotaxis response regulator CheB